MKMHPGFRMPENLNMHTWVVIQSTTREAGSITYPSPVYMFNAQTHILSDWG